MKASRRIAMIACCAVIASTAAFGQEWTKAQKEVWQVVEDSWAKVNKGDVDGMAANLHEKYQGWNNIAALPETKEMVVKWYKANSSMMKMENYSINPARIVVTDNAAVVDDYYWANSTTTVGEKKTTNVMSGKNVEFYVKEGGKWLLIGDLTIFNDNKKK